PAAGTRRCAPPGGGGPQRARQRPVATAPTVALPPGLDGRGPRAAVRRRRGGQPSTAAAGSAAGRRRSGPPSAGPGSVDPATRTPPAVAPLPPAVAPLPPAVAPLPPTVATARTAPVESYPTSARSGTAPP